MAEDLAALEGELAAMMSGLEDGQRRVLSRRIGAEVARANRRRMAAQQNPDGSAWEPRSKDTGQKRGRIRQKAGAMFRRLRTPRYMRVRSDADQVSVGFEGAAARIAGVHHYGLRDRVGRAPDAPEVTYPARQLLGLAPEDAERILALIAEHVSP